MVAAWPFLACTHTHQHPFTIRLKAALAEQQENAQPFLEAASRSLSHALSVAATERRRLAVPALFLSRTRRPRVREGIPLRGLLTPNSGARAHEDGAATPVWTSPHQVIAADVLRTYSKYDVSPMPPGAQREQDQEQAEEGGSTPEAVAEAAADADDDAGELPAPSPVHVDADGDAETTAEAAAAAADDDEQVAEAEAAEGGGGGASAGDLNAQLVDSHMRGAFGGVEEGEERDGAGDGSSGGGANGDDDGGGGGGSGTQSRWKAFTSRNRKKMTSLLRRVRTKGRRRGKSKRSKRKLGAAGGGAVEKGAAMPQIGTSGVLCSNKLCRAPLAIKAGEAIVLCAKCGIATSVGVDSDDSGAVHKVTLPALPPPPPSQSPSPAAAATAAADSAPPVETESQAPDATVPQSTVPPVSPSGGDDVAPPSVSPRAQVETGGGAEEEERGDSSDSDTIADDGSSVASANPHADSMLQLTNVLLSYATFNREVGYCQGMNFVAAMLLRQMDEAVRV